MKIDINSKIIHDIAFRADKTIGDNVKVLSKKNFKRLIRDRIFNIDPIFWNNGALSWGLGRYTEQAKVDDARYLNNKKLLTKNHQIKLVDNALYFYANYEKIDKATKDRVISFLVGHDSDPEGSVMYRPGQSSAFLDTIGMICPFLTRYGVETESPEAINLSMAQFRAFYKNGFDIKSGLPYHGYDLVKGEKCGIIGWGRGIGWLVVGLAESMHWLDCDSDEYMELESYFLKTLDKCMTYQRKDGGFSWQLQAMEGHLDTSTLSMIGYAISRYNIDHDSNFYKKELNIMVECLLLNVNEQGLVLNSSAECRGFSMHPQIFQSNSWGQGFSLLFMTNIVEIGKLKSE